MNYTGTDNLEVMAEAVNYNDFLTKLMLRSGESGALTLDFGAGIGTFSTRAREGGLNVECLEPDQKQAGAVAEQGFVVYRDIGEIPEERFDYVFSFNVMEHIEDHGAAAAQLFERVRPGGRALIYVPAFNVLFGAMDRKVGHHRRYTKASLTRLLTDAGFRIERAEYVDFLGFFASLMFNAVGNSDGNLNRGAVRIYDSIVFPLSRLADLLMSRVCGKNVFAIAVRPA